MVNCGTMYLPWLGLGTEDTPSPPPPQAYHGFLSERVAFEALLHYAKLSHLPGWPPSDRSYLRCVYTIQHAPSVFVVASFWKPPVLDLSADLRVGSAQAFPVSSGCRSGACHVTAATPLSLGTCLNLWHLPWHNVFSRCHLVSAGGSAQQLPRMLVKIWGLARSKSSAVAEIVQTQDIPFARPHLPLQESDTLCSFSSS